MKKCMIIAHRCGYKEANSLENSIDALIYSNNKKYIDGIELDTSLTKDKILVVFHNSNIKINNKKINIKNLTFKQLDEWYLKKYQKHLNTLEEMIKKIKSSKNLFIEIKNVLPLVGNDIDETINKVNDLLEKYSFKSTKILCFREDVLNKFSLLNKNESLCLLIDKRSYLYDMKIIHNIYFNKKIEVVGIEKNILTYNKAKIILKRKYLSIFTINTLEELEKVLDTLKELFEKYKDKIIITTNIPKIVDKRINNCF